MEDAHVHLLELENDPTSAYFSVFDGHGGSHVAKLASRYLHKQIAQSEAYLQGRISDALIEGFLDFDERMLEDDGLKDVSGSTAVVVLIKDNCIFCANAGDSRAVVSVSGLAVPLSIACPEVETCTITEEHEFIILACDGIWDVMTSQEVIDFCRTRLASGSSPDLICEQLIDNCLSQDCDLNGLGCDNMTVILVCLLQGRSQDDYLKQLQKNVTTRAGATNEEIFSTPSHSPPTAVVQEADIDSELIVPVESVPIESNYLNYKNAYNVKNYGITETIPMKQSVEEETNEITEKDQLAEKDGTDGTEGTD
uniref:protein-serine/threonine phosphatase n=1 Tax=Meloidogyne javanica TaxID=6303 RepID=A0A915MC12_MELJA